MRSFLMAIVGGAILWASPAAAEITNTSDNGFTVQHTVIADAPAEDVWNALIQPSKWWNPDHTWSGKSDNLYLVAQAGGCFCELIKSDPDANISTATGSVEHMRVIMVQREEALRMSGALGPLQGEAVSGTLTVEIQPGKTRTGVRFTYKVGGYMEMKVEDIAPAVDGVIGEQLSRLAELFGDVKTPAKKESKTETKPDDDNSGSEGDAAENEAEDADATETPDEGI